MESNSDKKKMNRKITLIAIPMAIVVIIGSVGLATNLFGINSTSNHLIEASVNADCLPSTLRSAAVTAFPVKEPALLPSDFALKAVEADGGGRAGVVLYYSDRSLCPFVGSLTDQIQNGTLVITVIEAAYIENGTDFQQREMEYYANDLDTVAEVQAIEVAGLKGVGWEPFEAQNIIRIDGKVVQSTPFQQGGMVRFFDDNDKTIYTITAIRPLSELLEVAGSIK